MPEWSIGMWAFMSILFGFNWLGWAAIISLMVTKLFKYDGSEET